MTATYGRVEHHAKSGKWRAVGYGRFGKSQHNLGDFDNRLDAIERLRKYVVEKEYRQG